METRTLICANAWENMKFLSNDPFFKKSQKKQKKKKPGKSKAKNTQKPKEETTKRTRSQGKPY